MKTTRSPDGVAHHQQRPPSASGAANQDDRPRAQSIYLLHKQSPTATQCVALLVQSGVRKHGECTCAQTVKPAKAWLTGGQSTYLHLRYANVGCALAPKQQKATMQRPMGTCPLENGGSAGSIGKAAGQKHNTEKRQRASALCSQIAHTLATAPVLLHARLEGCQAQQACV